jgi:transcriptional regulator with XRE-family HTH domain
MSTDAEFGRRVARMRAKLGASRDEIARRAGITRELLMMIEVGKLDGSDLSEEILQHLSITLRCSLDRLVGGREPSIAIPENVIGFRQQAAPMQVEMTFMADTCPHCHNSARGSRCGRCGHPLE